MGWVRHTLCQGRVGCMWKKQASYHVFFSEELRNVSISILNLPRGHETPSEDCNKVPAHLWSILLEFPALLNEPFSGLLTLILPVCQYCCSGIKFSLWGDRERKSKIIICSFYQEGSWYWTTRRHSWESIHGLEVGSRTMLRTISITYSPNTSPRQ